MMTAGDSRLKIRATPAPWWNGVEFLLSEGNAVAENIVLKEIPMGAVCGPTFRISMEMAQVLMDDLWNCGLRPTDGSGSAGALAATQKHLDDMRKLVFMRCESGAK